MRHKRLAAMPGLAGQVDDGSRPFCRDESVRDGLHHAIHGTDIHRKQPVVLVKPGLQYRAHIEQRRVIEQHIGRLGGNPFATGRKSVIRCQIESTVVAWAVAAECIPDIRRQNPCTKRGKMFGRCLPDAAIGSGHKAGLAGQICRCGVERHFTAPNVRPRTSCFWQNQPRTTIGPTAAVDTADNRPKNRPSGARLPSISLDSVAASVVVRRTVQ